MSILGKFTCSKEEVDHFLHNTLSGPEEVDHFLHNTLSGPEEGELGSLRASPTVEVNTREPTWKEVAGTTGHTGTRRMSGTSPCERAPNKRGCNCA